MRNPAKSNQRQEPYQNGQTPDTAPAPVPALPVVAWPDDESRQTVIRTNQEAWFQNDHTARGHRANSGRLEAELGKLNGQAEALRKQISDKVEEKAREDHYAAQRERARDAYGAALFALEAPVPSSADGVKVAPLGVEDPSPTGPQETPEQCPCGDPMVWDRTLNQYIHPLPNHKFEPAGESCQRRRDQTLAMNPVGEDAAVGS